MHHFGENERQHTLMISNGLNCKSPRKFFIFDLCLMKTPIPFKQLVKFSSVTVSNSLKPLQIIYSIDKINFLTNESSGSRALLTYSRTHSITRRYERMEYYEIYYAKKKYGKLKCALFSPLAPSE